MTYRLFEDKVVLITGASMGIGRELAFSFARRGARLVLAARSKEKLDQLSQEITALKTEVLVVPTDVTRSDEVDRLLQKVTERYGRIDILINNAGRGLYGFTENVPLQEVIDLFSLNFFGVVDLTQKALPLLKKQPGGMIINISSIVGHFAVPKMGAYSATKHALNAFSEALRIELSSQGIHVLSVYPGITDTNFVENAQTIDARPSTYQTGGRGMTPAQVAEKVIHAAAKKKRDEWINLQNRIVVSIHYHFPRLLDWIFRRFIIGKSLPL
jgi:short-subunit dehydrogenase